MSEDSRLREKLGNVAEVMLFRPLLFGGIIMLSLVASVLEGIGISFLVPIIKQSRAGSSGDVSGIVDVFISVYSFLGIPFTLETIIVGVLVALSGRYVASFLVGWLTVILRVKYVRHLRDELFANALDARIEYFDDHGSDELINSIVTETTNAGRLITSSSQFLEQLFLSLIYLGVAFLLAPWITVFTLIALVLLVVILRYLVESGHSVGNRIADANEDVQETVQAGTQGIRDVKLFSLTDEIWEKYQKSIRNWESATVGIRRNSEGMDNGYQLMSAFIVIILIYVALEFTSLSFAAVGVFLFSMFRLAPRASALNSIAYDIDGTIPHFTRTKKFIEDLDSEAEPMGQGASPPERVNQVTFDDVRFSYDDDDEVLSSVSFQFERGEFIAFAGTSGAGKSTVVSLLTRLYDPDSGEIRANGTAITQFDPSAWREHLSVVRQDPHLFNDTLYYNLTVGNRNATRAEVERVCDIASVSEFLDDLPSGLETVLGDDGIKLSGGQRQRVAIARALLKDADVLVLDEATSDLDTELESEVHQAIELMDRNYAILVVAHRLSTIRNADRIYTMADGEIIESGTHSELLDRSGQYAKLNNMQ
jgi:subfamily B ATP-binding cassette protein MsbA